MALSNTQSARQPEAIATKIAPDRRRHKRIAVTLLGRFMRASTKQEYPCKLVDISVGGAAIIAPVEVEEGERIVAYFDHIGGIEGTVARRFNAGFAIEFTITQHKREKLAAQLTWLGNRDELGGEERRHERIVPKNGESILKLADGISISCEVLDVSISGASIKTEARPEFGQEIMLGKLRGRVVRHHPRGIGIQFIDIQAPTALRRYFG
jgi:hypothetical protein